MHQDKVIVSARNCPVSRWREWFKYLNGCIVICLFIRYIRSQFQKSRSNNSRRRCITGNYFKAVRIIGPIGNIPFLSGIKIPIRNPVFGKIRMIEPIVCRMYGYFEEFRILRFTISHCITIYSPCLSACPCRIIGESLTSGLMKDLSCQRIIIYYVIIAIIFAQLILRSCLRMGSGYLGIPCIACHFRSKIE